MYLNLKLIMKIIYMNETLLLMQDAAKDLKKFDAWISSGRLKIHNEKPYLIITKDE